MLNIFENKRLLIAATAAVIAALFGVGILLTLILSPKNGEEDVSSEPALTVVDIKEAPADDTADPEILDDKTESGADVKASKVTAESGRSMGIDVSKWQGKIDWAKVKSSGIEFAFIRIGYRGENGLIYRDSNADYNIQQAIKNDVKVGVYFFSTAINQAEAEQEALWTAKAIEGYAISYPVVFDCEGFLNESSRMHSLSAAERTDNALKFLDIISGYGYDTMLYGAASELSHADYWQLARIEAEHKIWVAHYPAVTYPAADRPAYSDRCDAWQYTNRGSVNGITGNVDLVVCYFTKALASPKNQDANIPNAKPPQTEEEKLYTAVNETVTAKDSVNLRTAATTKSEVAAVLKNGETATRIGLGFNGWSKISYDGKTLYAITSYLTTDLSFKAPTADVVSGNTFTPVNDSVTAKESVNLRALPTTNSEIIGELKNGEFLTRTAKSDKGWSRLEWGGKTVYAVTNYLTDKVNERPAEPEAEPIPEDGFSSVDEQVTAKDETNLRTAPSTSESEIVYTLKNGEFVRRIGIHSNGWSKLEYNGQIVYAISSYLTK